MAGHRMLAVVSSLAVGGTERVVSLLAGAWARRGHQIAIATVVRHEEDAFDIDPAVVRVELGRSREGVGWPGRPGRFGIRVLRLRRLIREFRPTAVISFGAMTNVLSVLASPSRIPVVASERTYPPRNSLGMVRDRLRVLAYKRAARVVAQTERARCWIERATGRTDVEVIPNPVDSRFTPAPGRARDRVVVALGRLAPEKGHAVLVEAWRRVEHLHPGWKLWIVGDGPEKEALARASADLVARDRLGLPGGTREPEAWLRRAAVFVLPSLFEGFPNALLEAMASGCCVLASDCESGPTELLGPSVAGLLFPPGDAAGLARALEAALSDPELRVRLARQALEAARAYDLDEIAARWERVVTVAATTHPAR